MIQMTGISPNFDQFSKFLLENKIQSVYFHFMLLNIALAEFDFSKVMSGFLRITQITIDCDLGLFQS